MHFWQFFEGLLPKFQTFSSVSGYRRNFGLLGGSSKGVDILMFGSALAFDTYPVGLHSVLPI